MIYDKMFPNNPKALKTLTMEDWDCFSSPWASSALDEEVFTLKNLSLDLFFGLELTLFILRLLLPQ